MRRNHDRRQEAEVEITGLGARGDGIGRIDGQPVFVPFAAPADRLRVAITGERDGGLLGRISERLADGPERTAAPCPHFGDCGGCALQHLVPDAYLRWKQGLLGEALARRGVTADVEALRLLPPASRRRAVFTAARQGDKVVLGFNAAGSPRVVDLARCLVLDPRLVALLAPLRQALAAVLSPRESADVAVTLTDSGLDLWLRNRRPLGLKARQALIDLAEAQDLARIVAGAQAEPVILRRQPRAVFAGVAVALPPGVFLQPSLAGERLLSEAVVSALAGRKRIADLYAGCGTFTFALAAKAKVHAVEGDGPALAALTEAARGLGGRVTTERRDLARAPLGAAELDRFEGLVFDPPRAGAKEQAAEIARSRLDLVVAVSCHPGSFGRDAWILIDGGFRLERAMPVDQFPWSPHLELVGVFRR